MPNNSFLLNIIKTIKILRICGYATFSVHSIDDHRVFVSKADFFFFSANLAIACFVLFLSMTYKPLSSSDVKIMAYVIKFVMNAASFICIVSLLCVFAFRNKIWQLVRLIDSMHALFASIGVDINVKNFKLLFASVMAVYGTCQAVGLFIMAYFLGYYKKPTILVLFAYLSVSYSANNSWIMMFQFAIIRRFKAMNGELR
jgi:hypothetical protein